ncbi:two component regulator with propeller domain [Arcticibacter pallidicorallinus]|uniref:histidine kinase n=1 Tax=Arcticibacter pallidicorallinus TaxID=1259464 RepID=A0A2T0UCE7_9SPHI|nr:two-component regulator propeller domain-containing protein [Arcticibacter pallidicorallinus]PRY55610.1 two component regulator with propeller domain [Arcticibacter pallidicorallinus]
MKYLSIISLLAFICIAGRLHAEPVDEQYVSQYLDNSSGLSNSAINSIFQDSENLLWVGTWDGLNMFDGTEFKVFNYTNHGSGSIGNNVIQEVSEGYGGNIWVNTIGGITRIEKNSGTIHQYFYDAKSKRRITEREYELAADKRGQVYVYSRDEGLMKFDSSSNSFTGVREFPKNRLIKKLKLDGDGSLWVLEANGNLLLTEPHAEGLRIKRVIRHSLGINNFFFVNQAAILEAGGNMFGSFEKSAFKRIPGNFTGVRAVSRFRGGYILLRESTGAEVYDLKFRKNARIDGIIKKFSGLRITSLASSADGILWLGTDGNGLIKLHPKTNNFGLVKGNPYGINKPIRAFAEVGGKLWIGTKGKGIIELGNVLAKDLDLNNRRFISVSHDPADNSVFVLKKGVQDLVYIGTDGEGLQVYDLEKRRIIPWKEIQGTSRLPRFRSIYAVLQDRDSSLWLGTSGSGLIHLRIAKGPEGGLYVEKFRQYLSDRTEGLANDIIYSLATTDDRYLWIGCRYGGLSVLDRKTGRFKTFNAFTYPNSLSNNDVLSLYRDRSKGLWIGTSFGLNYLPYPETLKRQPEFTRFTTENGLPNNTIHAIEQSATGEIWLSTNKGLARHRPGSGIIITYNEKDGLQSNEFSDGAVWKGNDDRLFFGGIYGFNYFLPSALKGNADVPNLLVSHVQIGGKNVNENRIQVLKARSAEFYTYETEREMNFFRLTLKPLRFNDPAKHEFTYKLEGNDQSWNYSDANGSIVYNNVPPGKYKLLVRWASNEGVWTEPIKVMEVRVKPYFWLGYPALMFYILVLACAGYAFHRYRKNKIEMRYKLEMENHLRLKDESIHQQRLNFFTNIAHEIQTPLTLIMGSIEHYIRTSESAIRKNKEGYFLSLVHQHSIRLTYLVQQLLEFRKAEAGYLQVNEVYIDISKMLTSLSALFIPESEKSTKPYIRKIQDGIAGFVDKDKLEKILFNLLSNAFKHSGSGDRVYFDANYDTQLRKLRIAVSNTGCTLNHEEIKTLFQRFYAKRTNDRPSTGIGLSFAAELASLLGSDILVDLQDERICFSISLPVASTSTSKMENEVATSEPSFLHKSLIKYQQQPPLTSSEEENKSSVIDALHQKSRHSILIVEDDIELRYLVRQVLQEQYIVYEAGNGMEALHLLKRSYPSLIISDVTMPEMDGMELCREVKNTPATAQIPFIMLSARGTEENKNEGYEVGADAYIPKPFHIAYLLLRVRKLLEYHTRMQHLVKDQNISSQFMYADIEDADKVFLEAILEVIEKHLDDPELNATTIEKAIFISKMQLYRKLKALAGMTPAEFIKRIRLKHAADMLLTSQFTVSEIIYRTGFNSKSYFFREFKKIYLLAPNEYRAKQYETT